MKTRKGIRPQEADELRKARRLEPIRKSGKERHTLYGDLDEEEDEPLYAAPRESAFDYLDEEEE